MNVKRQVQTHSGLSAMSVGKQEAPNAERDLFLCATYHTDKVKIGGKGE